MGIQKPVIRQEHGQLQLLTDKKKMCQEHKQVLVHKPCTCTLKTQQSDNNWTIQHKGYHRMMMRHHHQRRVFNKV
jgi:hypothetical protein